MRRDCESFLLRLLQHMQMKILEDATASAPIIEPAMILLLLLDDELSSELEEELELSVGACVNTGEKFGSG